MDGGTLDVLLTLNNASRGNINRNNLLAVHGGTMSIGGSLSPGNAKQAAHINNRIRIERASMRLTAASFKTQGDCALEYVVPAGGFGNAAPFAVSGTATIAATTRLVIDAEAFVKGGGGRVTLFSAGTLADNSIPVENITVTTVPGGTSQVVQSDNAIVLKAGLPTTVILVQ